jgi:hypothetical protein
MDSGQADILVLELEKLNELGEMREGLNNFENLNNTAVH